MAILEFEPKIDMWGIKHIKNLSTGYVEKNTCIVVNVAHI